MTKKESKPEGMLSDGIDAGFWRDWLNDDEIKELPGERKKSGRDDHLNPRRSPEGSSETAP